MIIKTGNEILILTKEDNTLLLPLTYLPGQYRIRVAALASDQNRLLGSVAATPQS